MDEKWDLVETSDGIATYRLASWSALFDFIEMQVFNESNYSAELLWRGQRVSDWPLSTTLDRLFDRLGYLANSSTNLESISTSHLEAFQLAVRGRRGLNPAKLTENEWWSLGQHFGLATPLLDWTRSPFAAAYFAFETVDNSTDFRTVYGLNQAALLSKNFELVHGKSFEKGRLPIIEIIEPMSDDNPRLVNQGGCFTRGVIGLPLEKWVASAFEGVTEAVLLRIEIPNTGRLDCLRALNRMNINHLSLFPDLIGASRSTNLKLELLQR